MRKEDSGRRFSRELKLAAVQRMAMGANVTSIPAIDPASRPMVLGEFLKALREGMEVRQRKRAATILPILVPNPTFDPERGW